MENIPTKVVLESKPCPLGCDSNDEFLFVARDRLYNLPGEFAVVRCKTCGLIRTNPRPTPESIGFYYPDNYSPYQGTKVNLTFSKNSSYSFIKSFLRKIFQFNTECLPSIKPQRMLEIGCASGAFMHRMALNGWDVEGIEFSPQAAENARALGYPVYAGSIERAPDPAKPYDLVVGWMVLEHLQDPILALQKLHRWARPGGWLVVSLPNANAFEFRIFKKNWYALQVPTHLYHFTPKTLQKLLERGGWRIERVLHQRLLSNLVASIGFFLQELGYTKIAQKLVSFPEKPGRWHYLLYPLAYILSFFGQTGRMTIWARRIDD